MDLKEIIPLIEKAQSGQRIAQNQLIDRCAKTIYQTVYIRLNSKMDAEDITQDIMFTMIQKIHTLKQTSAFKSWLFRITLNKIKDFKRKKKFLFFIGGKQEIEDVMSYNSMHSCDDQPDMIIHRKTLSNEFNQMIQCLSHLEKEIFLLRWVDQMQINEIAQVLKKNENTVKTHLYRATSKIRKHQSLYHLIKDEGI